ncbi:type II restriction-modification system endonuclease [Litchfieldella qijiaojingensis]|uniref:Type II restriction-modification system endonuclease n=1 Tax=Litchfieldella qijiaojingensis TaxID=980347 RepID=A0ABQ2ZBY8_9GAMM|nr:Eco29kI family restriction endonuclease [Halomonas qijiaojingensis]GGY11733.1 type II restriction-modification system endonuclease [Halomonas qijiaojingensis]
MTDKIIPFNPLDKKHLGESVGQAMLRQPVCLLGELSKFSGAGVYAIYYTGDFPAYSAIAQRNRNGEFNAPIYVGKAVPSGARKGKISSSVTTALYNRLKEHGKSIEQAENLDLGDFCCRFLVVDDIWIPLGESLLIAKFSPIWNHLIDGFGNHTPGRGRFQGLRPRWDVLHPGRPWAEKCQPRGETMKEIMREAEDYLRNNPPPDDNSMISV